MKKRQYKMLCSLARESHKTYVHDCLMRGVNLGPPVWNDILPIWKRMFMDRARDYMKAAGLL